MAGTSRSEYTAIHKEDFGFEDSEDGDFEATSRQNRQTRRRKLRHIFAYGFLVFTNILYALAYYRQRGRTHSDANCVRPQLIHSPATEAVQYEKRRLWRDIDGSTPAGSNPYTGAPRPEFDEAWRKIIEPMTLKVSKEELDSFSEGDSTVRFKDGSGYLAEMTMYHELHCIKRIRHFLYKDHYLPNMSEADIIRENQHMDHCLEYFREQAVCRGDVTMSTFFWKDFNGTAFPASRVYSDHECVNFETLDTWARKRMVDMNDLSLFVPPGVDQCDAQDGEKIACSPVEE